MHEKIIESNFNSTSPLKSPKYERALLDFLSSERRQDNMKLSKYNMGLVVGPTGCGKSFFIKKCLRAHDSAASAQPNKPSLLIHLDFSSYRILNFDCFMNRFEVSLIQQLLDCRVEPRRMLLSFKEAVAFQLQPDMLRLLLHRLCSSQAFADLFEESSEPWELLLKIAERRDCEHPQGEGEDKKLLRGVLQLLRDLAVEKESMESSSPSRGGIEVGNA